MPNWCHNTMTISGDEAEVLRLTQILRQPGEGENTDGTPLFFSSLVPEPKDIGDGWYGWRVENWGTKWEPHFDIPPQTIGEEAECFDPPGLIRREGLAEYDFDTAWGPPLEWMERVAKMFPQLRFAITYGEPGMDFGGKVVFVGGEVVSDEEGGAEQYLDESMLWF